MLHFWGHAGVLASVYEAELDDAHCLKLMSGIMACPGGKAVCEWERIGLSG